MGHNLMPILETRYVVETCGISASNTVNVDLSSSVPELKQRYDIVLHAAGKSHIMVDNNAEEQAFYDVNYQGTINLCKALEKIGVPKVFIFISTVAVYGCESGEQITEKHPLNGKTAYAKSKILAEQYLSHWCNEHNVVLGILRPSLMAGKNASGNLGAMVNGIHNGYYVNISGGKAYKSLLMADDIGHIIPLVAHKGGIYNVCDTRHITFGELSISIARQLGKNKPISIPYWAAWSLAKVGDFLGDMVPFNSYKLNKMTKSLTFSNQKACDELGWIPTDVITNYKI